VPGARWRRWWPETVRLAIAEQSGWKLGAKPAGAIVVRCLQENCAGFQPGDWLIAYGFTAIRAACHLTQLMISTPKGGPVTLSIVRDRKELKLAVHGGKLDLELL